MMFKFMSSTVTFRKCMYVLFAASLLLQAFTLYATTSYAATRIISCSTVSCLTSALANALPGDDIVLAAGTTFSGTFTGAANGTLSDKITLESASSANPAILSGSGTGSGYGLHITGDYWVVKNLKITNSQKGIMLDNSNSTLIDGIEVYNVGQEGVHFRDGSSNNTIQNSYVHDTGKGTGASDAGFGEGIYVGSDKGKWATYNPAADNNVITNNRIGPNVTAEHVDIKEGTTGTVVSFNTLNGTGISGANFADSFIDAKGNNASIHDNTGSRNGNSVIVDAFQLHQQVAGWGLNNDFYNNTVNLDTSTPYVINAASGTSATAHNNIRNPSGNMYLGNVTITGGGVPDTTAPTAPSGLTATAVSSSQINLSWNASTDNVGVTGYDIYRDGTLVGSATATAYSNTGLTASTTYSYTVKAKDASGNVSAASNTATAATLPASVGSVTLTPTGDSYTRDDTNANINYGSDTMLYLKTAALGSNRNAYLMFDLSGVASVTSAKLRIYATSSAATTVTAYQTTDNWAQSTITWNNAPAAGAAAGSVNTNTPVQYYEIDVTSYVQSQAAGDKIVSFVLKESAGKYTQINSSKNASNKPQLAIN